ncbi:unnamed protein product [Coffea canephora]|uniref:Uncharacterized protein n=2 Tax=Coffea TaxID=13442 RepID=A0A068V2R4_COFCA|nr:unnamed protein product [Coffea canephora]
MAESNLPEILKPFYQRAAEAETRLERLEAAIASDRNAGNDELLNKVRELQSKLENVKAEQALEREKAQKELKQLNAENAKLQYRITHLVRAVKDADCMLQSK